MDSNAIRSLNAPLITSKLDNNRIIATIAEVKYEVSSLTGKLGLIHLENLGIDAYIKMKDILSLQSTQDVVDYYYNKGAADVALLAHALTTSSAGMFKDDVVIVTDDVALRTACDQLKIRWESVSGFKLL